MAAPEAVLARRAAADAAAVGAGPGRAGHPDRRPAAAAAPGAGHRAAAAGRARRCSSACGRRCGRRRSTRSTSCPRRWRSGTSSSTRWPTAASGRSPGPRCTGPCSGSLASVVIATPLGLLVAKVPVVRAAIGPLLAGMQSLPSVAWVPAAVLWFGLTDATIYFVVLLGAIPSIANGLVAGIDQVPPILPRVGQVMGAGRLDSARLILLPAALPGYLAGTQAGLGVLLALADGRGDHRDLPAAGHRPGRLPQGRQRLQLHARGDRGDLPDPARRRGHRAAGVPAAGAAGAARPAGLARA